MQHWPMSKETMVRLTEPVRQELEVIAAQERRSVSAVIRGLAILNLKLDASDVTSIWKAVERSRGSAGASRISHKICEGVFGGEDFSFAKFLIAFASSILKTHPAEVCPVCSPIFEQWLGVLSLGAV